MAKKELCSTVWVRPIIIASSRSIKIDDVSWFLLPTTHFIQKPKCAAGFKRKGPERKISFAGGGSLKIVRRLLIFFARYCLTFPFLNAKPFKAKKVALLKNNPSDGEHTLRIFFALSLALAESFFKIFAKKKKFIWKKISNTEFKIDCFNFCCCLFSQKIRDVSKQIFCCFRRKQWTQVL